MLNVKEFFGIIFMVLDDLSEIVKRATGDSVVRICEEGHRS